KALQSLDEAIRRDEKFVAAYCYAARANDLLYFFDLEPTRDRILLAETAVNAALRLRPDSAEAHFAMADFLFRCHQDYDRALEELAIARPGLPNSSPFFILSGYINRRRNHWPEAERDFSTAVALDPRNPNAYNLLADTYVLQRRFPEAVQTYDRVMDAGEQTPIVQFRRALALFNGTGNSQPLREVLANSPDMDIAGGQTPVRILFAVLDGNYAEAERVLAVSPRADFQDIDFSFYYPKAWFEAIVAQERGDSGQALNTLRSTRAILAQRLIIKPEHARTIAVLAQVDARLGQKELALQEAKHAIDLMPISKDVNDGGLVLEGRAPVYTWSNQHDSAIINVFRDRHQIDGVHCLLQSEVYLAQPGVDLREDCYRPCVLRFNNQALRQNRAGRAQSIECLTRIASFLRDNRLKPSLRVVEAEIYILKVCPR